MHPTKSNGLTTPHGQPAETYKPSNLHVYYPIVKRMSKVEATLIARFALAGYVVLYGQSDDYTVCQFDSAQYCQDLTDLYICSVRLGASYV
jgi:hypothetical protein